MTTRAEYACWIIIIVVNLYTSVRAKSHVEADGCGLAGTIGCRSYHILELDIEFTVLMTIGNLTVGTHVHPARVGISRNIAQSLYTIAGRNHTRDTTIHLLHRDTTIRRYVNFIIILTIEWELEAHLDRTRLPIIICKLRSDILLISQLWSWLILE